MKKWLQNDKTEKSKHTVFYCVYMRRIQKRIARELDMLLWLAVHHPNVFLNKSEVINDFGHATHKRDESKKRLKKLLLTVKVLNPNCNVELVFQNIKGD